MTYDMELRARLYQLDWIKILADAIEMRPTSWNDKPVREWRNASDEICSAVIRALEKEGKI
jgi:hypothetical protein